jgi:acyl dehydratase
MADIIKESELPRLIGEELDSSEWLEITQERVNQFADAINDHQFIHVDSTRASESAFGGTIAVNQSEFTECEVAGESSCSRKLWV